MTSSPIASNRWVAALARREEFRNLLGTLEAVLPLRRRSDLAKAELARRILCGSEGILGEIVADCNSRCGARVSTGAERISAKIIEDAVLRHLPTPSFEV